MKTRTTAAKDNTASCAMPFPGSMEKYVACRCKRLLGGTPQTKIRVNQPGDCYEQEANRVAEQMMHMPEPRLLRVVQEIEKEAELLQTKQIPGTVPEVTPWVALEIASLRGGGQPLPESERAFFESRFEHDFSQVRIHVDGRSARVARSVQARAFTVGQDVVFGPGMYAPETRAGRKLLAHELTHVVQQAVGGSRGAKPKKIDRRGRAKSFASTHLSTVPAFTLQREPTFEANCTEYDRCRVMEPFGAANQLVDRVLGELSPIVSKTVTSGRIIDLLNVHFHDPAAPAARARIVLDKFRAIKAELGASIKFVCHPPPSECESDRGLVGAFTPCAAGGDISLCSAYYSSNCKEKARLLIHEVAHHIPELCTDHAYAHEASYMTLSPDKASSNPDTYAQFAKMVFLGAPSCKNCSTEIQLRPGQY